MRTRTVYGQLRVSESRLPSTCFLYTLYPLPLVSLFGGIPKLAGPIALGEFGAVKNALVLICCSLEWEYGNQMILI